MVTVGDRKGQLSKEVVTITGILVTAILLIRVTRQSKKSVHIFLRIVLILLLRRILNVLVTVKVDIN